MQIWRAELANGGGVFDDGVIDAIMRELRDRGAQPYSPYSGPTPPRDPVLGPKLETTRYDDRFRFGCVSEEQLFGWFASPMVRVQMNRRGVLLAIYDCPEAYVVVGATQCIFLRNEAKAVLRKPFPVRPSGPFRLIAGGTIDRPQGTEIVF